MNSDFTVQIAPSFTLPQAVELSYSNNYGVTDITTASQRWLKTAVHQLTAYLQAKNQSIELTAVTPRHINAWITHLSHQDLKAISVNSYLRGVKTFFSRLQRNGIIGHNPAGPVKFLPEPPPQPKHIHKRHYNALLNATVNHPLGIRDRAILGTLWGTGCRISELAKMDITKLEELGNGRYAIYVVGKGNRPRHIYLKGKSGKHLTNWLTIRPTVTSPALFLSRKNGRLSSHSISAILRRLRVTANIPPNSPTNAHAFRHAFAIRKLNQGYDLPLVSAWLGHHSPEFTAKVYVIRSESEIRQRFFENP